jgi:hypothetical protein
MIVRCDGKTCPLRKSCKEETPAFIRMLTMEEAMEIYGEDS